MNMKQYDVFISYAHEDEKFVEPLDKQLSSELTIWRDRDKLRVVANSGGFPAQINEGILNSRYGIVVTSPAYFKSNWTKKELDALHNQEAQGSLTILVICKDMTHVELSKVDALVSAKYCLTADDGVDAVAKQLVEAIKSNDSFPRPVTLGGHHPQIPIYPPKWFNNHSDVAFKGLQQSGLTGFMEVRMWLLYETLEMSTKKLLEAARKAEITTVNWPFGVVLTHENDEPKATNDGIVAEIKKGSYDYWTIKKDGTFYLLRTLSEDMDDKEYIFSNYRIDGITEALIYAKRLYSYLGVSPDSPISIEIQHSGFKDRFLTHEKNREHRYSKSVVEDRTAQKVTTFLKNLANENDLVEIVYQFVHPFFELFNINGVEKSIIEERVKKFIEDNRLKLDNNPVLSSNKVGFRLLEPNKIN